MEPMIEQKRAIAANQGDQQNGQDDQEYNTQLFDDLDHSLQNHILLLRLVSH